MRRASIKRVDIRLIQISTTDFTQDSQSNFPSNFISTSKYNLVNFLPKSLLIQFKRYANIYFFITAFLQSVPEISPLHPFSAIAPLIFVLGLSMLREGLDDLGRHRSDRELNNRTIVNFSKLEQSFKVCNWSDIKVGDFLVIKKEEFIPADVVVFNTSLSSGVCYIETSSLDGEKNLKIKSAVDETFQDFNPLGALPRIKGTLKCEMPNSNLYTFDGMLSSPVLGNRKVLVSSKNLLLRGAKLKNTDWIVGLVVYTGKETKIMKNSDSTKFKQSNIEKTSNKLILVILFLELIICLISAIGYVMIRKNKTFPYLENEEGSDFINFLKIFCTYFLLNNTMIPISMIVSLEFVKLCQAYLINKDELLYCKQKDRPAKVFTSSINEELGQVEYIFSDKTGTLTCNRMEFKLCLIGQELYGDKSILPSPSNPSPLRRKSSRVGRIPPSQRDRPPFENFLDQFLSGSQEFKEKEKENYLLMKEFLGTQDCTPTFLEVYSPKQEHAIYTFRNQEKLIKEFFTILAVCHECLIEQDKGTGKISYQGQSPDEIALVTVASQLGFKFKSGSAFSLNVRILDNDEEFQLLHLFEFNSDRKRMSIIVRHQKILKLYIKGADNIILGRLEYEKDQPYLKKVKDQLDVFSKCGLRTLCIAMKVLQETEYQIIMESYQMALCHPNREAKLAELADSIEKRLFLIGVTAVEDKLQDSVPKTINDLLMANIKVWMLTGDKLETAENIAKSCRLIQDDMTILRCNENTVDTSRANLLNNLEIIQLCKENKRQTSMIIEGESLRFVLATDELFSLFLNITKECESVVCCRVTPRQKAEVVRMVKNKMKKITLAIGDGANDVNMIQEAHIGIGIYGEEGMQAVQASDYAVGEFKALWRLLLVHGRWSYIRVSEMILYFFYKNIVFTLPQFFYSFDNSFSGETIFDDWYITFFNMIFTALPVVIFSITNQDVYFRSVGNDGSLIQFKYLKANYPLLYFVGQRNQRFCKRVIFQWILQGFLHGLIIYLIVYRGLSIIIISKDGFCDDVWLRSIITYTVVILTVNLRLLAACKYWNSMFILSIVFTSIVPYFIYIFVADSIDSFLLYKTADRVFSTFYFYGVIFLCSFSFMLIDFLIEFLKMEFFTDLIDYFRFLLKNNKVTKSIFFENLDEYIQTKRLRNSYFVDPDTSLIASRKSTIKEENRELIGFLKETGERDRERALEIQVDKLDRQEEVKLDQPENDRSMDALCNGKNFQLPNSAWHLNI